jgi:hypothetical protein
MNEINIYPRCWITGRGVVLAVRSAESRPSWRAVFGPARHLAALFSLRRPAEPEPATVE